jgi:hypothetical protein
MQQGKLHGHDRFSAQKPVIERNWQLDVIGELILIPANEPGAPFPTEAVELETSDPWRQAGPERSPEGQLAFQWSSRLRIRACMGQHLTEAGIMKGEGGLDFVV